MPMFKSLGHFGAEIDKLAHELDVVDKIKITRQMGILAQRIAERAASADLGGDPKFSGWRPSLATQLKTTPTGATVLMPTRTSAGPWTVAEFGRNQGNAGGFAGPGINIRTGKTSRRKSGDLRKVRARVSKRWNGTTDPKFTASQAINRMTVELPLVADDGIRKVIKRHFDVT